MSGQGALNERELVSRCNRGDESAWTVLYHAYRNRVYRITHWHRWRFPPEEADEIMQEVFLALVGSLRSFDFRSSLDTYISHVATNRCISALRKRTASRAGGQAGHVSLGEVEMVLKDGSDPPDRTLLDREQQEILRKGRGSLGEPCRRILQLRFDHELSYQRIAAELNIQEGTVASRLSRCLAELREVCERLSQLEGKRFIGLATKD